jgi:protein TonB
MIQRRTLLLFIFTFLFIGSFYSSAKAGMKEVLNEKPDTTLSKKDQGETKAIGMSVAQTEPEFPGGQDSLSSFLFKNLHQPEKLSPKGQWKHEFVGFKVDKTGKLKDSKIMLSLGEKADAEALRIISLMPDWKPATVAGNPVDKDYVLSIDFFVSDKE